MRNQFSRSASKEEEEWESDTNTSCHKWTSLTGESKRKVLKVQIHLTFIIHVHCVYQLLPSKMKDSACCQVMGGTMCSESNHLSPNDFFSLLAYGIIRILKIYTAYCPV